MFRQIIRVLIVIAVIVTGIFISPILSQASSGVDLKINSLDGPQIEVYPGDTLTISWTSQDVRNCYAIGKWGWVGPQPVSGSVTATVPDHGYNITLGSIFTLECTAGEGTGQWGEAKDWIQVNVHPSLKRQFVLLRANGESVELLNLTENIDKIDNVNISWESQNVKSCVAGGQWSGSRPPNGSEVIKLPKVTKTTTFDFSIECVTTSDTTVKNNIQVRVVLWQKRPVTPNQFKINFYQTSTNLPFSDLSVSLHDASGNLITIGVVRDGSATFTDLLSGKYTAKGIFKDYFAPAQSNLSCKNRCDPDLIFDPPLDYDKNTGAEVTVSILPYTPGEVLVVFEPTQAALIPALLDKYSLNFQSTVGPTAGKITVKPGQEKETVRKLLGENIVKFVYLATLTPKTKEVGKPQIQESQPSGSQEIQRNESVPQPSSAVTKPIRRPVAEFFRTVFTSVVEWFLRLFIR